MLSKIGRYLEHGDPAQEWVAVVIYPTRALEQTNLQPYRCLLDSDQLVRIYLNELPPAPLDRFVMGILELITSKPETAMKKAQAMVPIILASKQPENLRRLLLQLIETVIVHQFPDWLREEIDKMLQVTDFRQTRVFQEALEEGIEKGIEKGIETVATRMFEMGRPVTEIVKMTGLTAAQVRSLVKKAKK